MIRLIDARRAFGRPLTDAEVWACNTITPEEFADLRRSQGRAHYRGLDLFEEDRRARVAAARSAVEGLLAREGRGRGGAR